MLGRKLVGEMDCPEIWFTYSTLHKWNNCPDILHFSFSKSFVALSMLLGLPLSDFLYLSAKVGGGYDGNCKPIKKTVMLPGMDTFLEGDVWYNQIKNDLALYKAVNQSLDLTIDRLGREEFTQNLMQYQKMLAAANDICPNRTVYHCTENGKKIPANQTDCIWFDVGCGDPCLDDVAASFGM